MRLISLRLKNFMGLRSFAIEPNGESISIFGDNGVGKTTLASAASWVLFGKDSVGSSDFSVKTLTPDGEPIHGLDHEVEAVLQLADGRPRTLRRVYRETWTKARGAAQKEFSGHTTDYFIDGVPMQKKEYDAAIATLAPEETFRLLTDPIYFPERLHWSKRRKLLLEVCGDVTDAEVIASDRALADLEAVLTDRKMEDHRKVVEARRKEINRELEKLPVRIDEVHRGLPELPEGSTEETLAVRLRSLREERRAAETERQRIEQSGEAADLTKRLREVEGEIQAAANRAGAQVAERTEALRREWNDLRTSQSEAARETQKLRREAAEARSEVERLDQRLTVLRERRAAIDAEAFAASLPDRCAACSQSLPPESVEAARAKALEAFNEGKARRLAEVDTDGRRLRAQRDDLAKSADALDPKIAAAEAEAGRLETEAAGKQGAMDAASALGPDPLTDPERQRLTTEAEALRAKIAELATDSSLAAQVAAEKVGQLDAEIGDAERTLAKFEQRHKGEERISDLKAEERTLAAELEDLERQTFLMEEFIRAKVRLLEGKINARFKIARFQLFRVLVNGGLEECCEVTVNGVPYSSGLNNGARINGGLDIINSLGEHFGFSPPVFIDGAESVTELIQTTGQQIRLIVSAADKQLRVERSEP